MVIGDKAEDAFRQSMIFSQGSLSIFWSNPLVSTLMAIGFIAVADAACRQCRAAAAWQHRQAHRLT
jgi:TctA family transporter